jgi:hypothetical protein
VNQALASIVAHSIGGYAPLVSASKQHKVSSFCTYLPVDPNGPFRYNYGMINEFEAILIMEDLRLRGITNYTMLPGNNCVWVSYGLVNSYYIFRNGQIADIQYD